MSPDDIAEALCGLGIREKAVVASPQTSVGLVYNLNEPALPFTNGVYLTTGFADDLVSNGGSNLTTVAEGTSTGTSADGRILAALAADAGTRVGNLYDSAGFIMRVRPANRTLNLKYCFASEEFESPIRSPYSADPFAVFVAREFSGGTTNWVNIATIIDEETGDEYSAGIDCIGPDMNSSYYLSNVATNANGTFKPAGYPEIPLAMSCNGAIISTTATMGVTPGADILFAPIIADRGGHSFDSTLLIERYGLTSGADIKVDMTADSATSNLVVTIKNVGPIPATGVVWTNALPAGLSLVAMNPLIDGTSIGVGTNVYNVGDLAVGASRTNTLQVAPAEPGTYLCRAEAWPWEGDFNPDDNVATATLDFGAAEPRADLEVMVVPLFEEVLWNGGNRTNVITVAVVNNGPDAAENVVVTVSNLLSSVTFTAPAMTIPSLAGGETRAYTIATTATPATSGIDTFFASATAATADPDESNNQDSADVSYPAYTDVSVALSFEEPVYGLRGGRLCVVTANAGPSPVQELRTQVSFEGDDSEFRNDLPVGGCVTNWVEFGPVSPLGAATVSATAMAIANADAGVEDIDHDNDGADAEAPVIWPDLSVELSATPNPVESEGTVTYVASLACAGDGVTNAAVKITLPSNRVATEDVVPAGFTADGADAYVLSAISIDAGATNSWTITVQAPLTTTDDTLDAAFETVPVPDWDATPGNNAAQVETAVNRALQADLSVTVAPAATVVEWNDGNRTNVIHVVVKNNGPDEVSVSSFSASNTLTGVTFQLPLLDNPRLASGVSLEFDIRTSAFSEIVGTDVFTARVSGSLPDPDTDNNAASCEVQYPGYADVGVALSFVEPVYGFRTNYLEAVSSNNGPLDMMNIVTEVTCQGTTHSVTNDLAAGAVVTNRIEVGEIASVGAATVSAEASIGYVAGLAGATASPVADYDHDNDNATAEADVIWPDVAVTLSAAPATVAAGGTVTFTATATAKDGRADDLSFTMTLPDGSTETLSGVSLPDGGSTNWTFSATAPVADADSTMTGTFALSPVPQWDADASNNEATASVTASARQYADVAAYASFGAGTLSGRENGEYTFYAAVSNVSDVAAENVSVQLVLDTSDATWVAPDGWTLSGNTLALDGAIAELAAGAGTNFEATVAISGRVTQLKAQTVVSAVGDPVAANDTATATRSLGWPDLRVVMLPSKESAAEGEIFECKIFVLNNGGGAVTYAALTNTWSDLAAEIAAEGAEIDGLTAVFPGLNLAAGTSTSLVVRVTVGPVPPNTTGTITGEAACTVPFGDQTPDDNRATCSVTVSPYAARGSVDWFYSTVDNKWFAQIRVTNTGTRPVESLWFVFESTLGAALLDPNEYLPAGVAPGAKVARTPKVMPDGRTYVDLSAFLPASFNPGDEIILGVSQATQDLYEQPKFGGPGNRRNGSVPNKASERILAIGNQSGGGRLVVLPNGVSNFDYHFGYRCGVMYHPCDLNKNFHIEENEYRSALGNLRSGADLPRDPASADPGGAYPQFDSPEAEFLFVSEGYLGEKTGVSGGYIWSMSDRQWRIYYK
ncbi:MAG: DUF11 domain-containing protein [Kiritimatiellae bacterium]|nr:DUF11 domain-containing protein [Kiritimatiellia bacterium]